MKFLPALRQHRLPSHLVGLVTLSQAERAGEVAGEQLNLLDVGNQGLVNSLLVGGAVAVDLLLLQDVSVLPFCLLSSRPRVMV